MNLNGGTFLKIRSSINLTWGHARSHKKIGPDRFSRFDVYWIQTYRQTSYIIEEINGSSLNSKLFLPGSDLKVSKKFSSLIVRKKTKVCCIANLI